MTPVQPSSPSSSFGDLPSMDDLPQRKVLSLNEQRDEIVRDRKQREARQVTRWQQESCTPLMPPRMRFVALLEEARRHEVASIQLGRCSRPHNEAVNQTLLISDVNATYAKLIEEAKRLFDDRKNRGMGDIALNEMCAQATSSFASLYPWSDGITCRDIGSAHPAFGALLKRNGVAVGASGITTINSFSAALSCSQMKLQASSDMKQQRISQYFDAFNELVVHLAPPAAMPRPVAPRPVCCAPPNP